MKHYFWKNNLISGVLSRSIALLVLLAFSLFSLCACGEKVDSSQGELTGKYKESKNRETDGLIFDLVNNTKNKKIAVVYFSEGDDVKVVAEKFAETFDADIFEIEPEVPYTEEDLDFENDNSRVNLEADFSVFDDEEIVAIEDYPLAYGIVPATVSEVEEKEKILELPKIKKINVNKYNIIILGFPIWKDDAPKVIYTFVGDLKNKILVPFCTAEEMGLVDQYINNYVDLSNVTMSGRRFDKNVTSEELKEWMELLEINF